MTIKPLPQFIQPIRLAKQGATFSGKLPLSAFLRLQDLLSHADGEVEVELQLGEDEEQMPYVKGTLKACLPLICQRCLKTLDYELTLQVSLSPVLSEAAGEKLPAYYEPLLLQEDRILLCDLIEEELLLGLPPIPKHEQLDCALKAV